MFLQKGRTMRLLFILIFLTSYIFAYKIKTPSDVFSYAMLVKKSVEYLRKSNGINKPFPTVPPQKHKFPRHVI